ncbi:integral membrane protein, putative [Aspergillus fumigatus Af293]|uniref:Integral membrane protein, putative n=1 Tax=Aspergillus fumigatus (strain ATCC MYA-4609 / CBS 101355 / FGSC A1100 / Af293) TaxID=330879 RepID=Q4WKN4_ASPFU|nr:integral membrane protein, putative [Aspergillus fumigatus Af293]EAL87898.2 integral membrane protein, putative [Aspergillus fumigatus Af293]
MAVAVVAKHPVQRMSSPSRGFSALVHLFGLASFIGSFKFMHENPNRANEAYGWHFQYLTVIGLALSTLTFAVALLADLTLSARLFLVKNLLSICSAPMEVLISVLYWGLRMIDERLVVPDWAYIPMHAGKYWFSRRTSHCVIDRSPTSFPSMDNQYRTRPWPIKRNRVRLLGLDRAMLQVQRMVPVSDLRAGALRRPRRSFRDERRCHGAEHCNPKMALRSCQWLRDSLKTQGSSWCSETERRFEA